MCAEATPLRPPLGGGVGGRGETTGEADAACDSVGDGVYSEATEEMTLCGRDGGAPMCSVPGRRMCSGGGGRESSLVLEAGALVGDAFASQAKGSGTGSGAERLAIVCLKRAVWWRERVQVHAANYKQEIMDTNGYGHGARAQTHVQTHTEAHTKEGVNANVGAIR